MLCKSEQVKVNTACEGDSFEEIRLLMSWPSLHELPVTAYTFDFDAETGAADDLNVSIDENGIRKVVGLDANALLQNFAINELPVEEQDCILTPYWGIPADDYETFTYHEMTYEISRYYSDRYEEPIIEGVVILDLIHSYTDHMARLAWDFMSHFSRLPDGGLLTDGDGSRFPYEAD